MIHEKKIPILSAEQITSFWQRVAVKSASECWKWTGAQEGEGAKHGTGYGCVSFDGHQLKCHRLAYQLSRGEIAKGKLVCHTCDNPPCCNPSHLFLGTHKENDTDMRLKGRAHVERGSKRYNAKLNEEQVAIIKAEAPFRKYGWGRAIAKRFGVGATAINNIVQGHRWKHVP